MSTAQFVPETRKLSGDDAWKTLRKSGYPRLMKDAFRRMRVADGFSHARSIALMFALVMVQGAVGIVGLTRILNKPGITEVVMNALRQAVPGPAGGVLTAAAKQGHATAGAHGYSAVLLGLLGAAIAGTTAMGQLERGLNRLYGVEKDRPAPQKYGLAFLLAMSAGLLATVAFTLVAFGKSLFRTSGGQTANFVWGIMRWPLGIALITIAVTVLFSWSPRRTQPKLSWLAFGAGVSVAGLVLVTAGLEIFYRFSTSFGQTYGPLAGVIALLFWCMLSAMTLFYGAAIAAQLEGVRKGASAPQDSKKVEESEPAHAPKAKATTK